MSDSPVLPELPELPDDFPLVVRRAVRVVVQDAAGSVLLFRSRDSMRPQVEHWWELPGGGIDGDETFAQTAARELFEETGLRIDPAQVGPPLWRRSATFVHRATRRVQHEVVVRTSITEVAPSLDGSHRSDTETADFAGYRWAPVDNITSSTERFYPGRLPHYLADFLAGREIAEPFEYWE